MPVKYHCPKCGKRFVDWGAEKVGFLCPHCESVELLRIGAREEQLVQPPSLRRSTPSNRKSIPTEKEVLAEEEGTAAEVDELESGGENLDAEEVDEEGKDGKTANDSEEDYEATDADSGDDDDDDDDEEEGPADLDFENGDIPADEPVPKFDDES